MSGEVAAALARVQREVAVPKARYNDYGKFHYRGFEDIVAALKGPCAEAGLAFRLEDEVVQVGDRHYVRSTATAFMADGSGGELSVAAWAREAEHKSGSDDAQLTGMASSYARKYALCGLFAIDGRDDPDAAAPAPEPRRPPSSGPFVAHCRSCGARYSFESEAQMRAAACCPAPDYVVEG